MMRSGWTYGIGGMGVEFREMMLRIGIAVLIGTVIGVEREIKNRPAGMRTHVLVCLGACMIASLECSMQQKLMHDPSMNNVSMTLGRISAQVVSGIGFLGAGTIFTSQRKIAGLTTAASLWNVACLGLMTGFGYYWMALMGCLVVMIVLLLLQKIVRVNTTKKVEVKFMHRVETLAFINSYFGSQGIKILDIDFHVESREAEGNLYTNNYTLHLPANTSYTDVINHLAEHANVQSVHTTNA